MAIIAPPNLAMAVAGYDYPQQGHTGRVLSDFDC